MRALRAILASIVCLAVAFVTTGSARNLHEQIAHAGESIVSGAHGGDHEADHADHAHGDHHDHDHAPSEPAKPTHTDRDHCATCVSLASLGKMPNAPPAVLTSLDAADSVGSVVSAQVHARLASFLNAAVSERGPPVL